MLPAGQRGLLTTVVFSPQQGFEAAPQASASVCQGCRSPAQGLPIPSTSPPSLSSIVNHGSPQRVGEGVGGPGWPCSDPSPPGPGTPLTVLNGPILALDADLDVYAVVTYQLLGSQSGLFDINNSTGKASVPPQHSQPGSKSSSWDGSEPTARSRASLVSAGSGVSMETPFLTSRHAPR